MTAPKCFEMDFVTLTTLISGQFVIQQVIVYMICPPSSCT